MTPEQQIERLTNQLRELTTLVENMQNYHTCTPEFRKTINRGDVVTDGKSASSENQAVDEGATGTYSVLKPPDGFVKVIIDGTNYYIPYYG